MSQNHNYTGDPDSHSEQDALFNAAQPHTSRPDRVEGLETPASPPPKENAMVQERPRIMGKTVVPPQRKIEANRHNAKKSTGPRTARGKAISRFNALRHGLLARHLTFAPGGEILDPGLRELVEALREKYGRRDDVTTELLLEAAIIDYWRNAKALEYEAKYFAPGGCGFHPQGGMPSLQRYQTAARNALLKDLELLEEQQTSPADVGEAEIADDTDVGDGSAGSKTEDEEESEAA